MLWFYVLCESRVRNNSLACTKTSAPYQLVQAHTHTHDTTRVLTLNRLLLFPLFGHRTKTFEWFCTNYCYYLSMNSCTASLIFFFSFCFSITFTNLFTFEFKGRFPFKTICFSFHFRFAAAHTHTHNHVRNRRLAYVHTNHDDHAPMRQLYLFAVGTTPNAFRCNVQFYDTTNAKVDAARATRYHTGIIGLQFSVVLAAGVRDVRTGG